MTPDVSICIVNFNGGEMLRDLLRSLQGSDPDLATETVVVDNASTDASADSLETDFPAVRFLRNADNRGFATANDQAAAVATGRYLLFLNNDTLAVPGTITRLVGFLDEHPDFSAAGPKLLGTDGQAQRTARNLPTLRSLLRIRMMCFPRFTPLFRRQYRDYRKTFDPEISGQAPQLAAAALLVRREVFEQIGGWDANFPFGVEDVDFCLRLSRHGPIQYLADVAIRHHGRISSRANYDFTYLGYEIGYAHFLRKHHRRRWAHWLYKLLITLDTPVRVLFFRGQYWVACAAGEKRRESQDKYYRRLLAARRFMFYHLGRFWRA